MPTEGCVCAADGSGGRNLLSDRHWAEDGRLWCVLVGFVGVLPNFALVQECLNSPNADHSLQQIRDHSWQEVQRSAEDNEDTHGRECDRGCKLLSFQFCVGRE